MKKLFAFVCLLFFGGLLSAAAQSGVDALPDPVSNNAVAELKVHGQLVLFSFMGIGAKKTPDAITNTGLFRGHEGRKVVCDTSRSRNRGADRRDGRWRA